MELHFATLGGQIGRFLALGGTSKAILVYFYGSGARPWTPFAAFLEKARKGTKKIGNRNGCIFAGIPRFPRKYESALRLRRRERIEAQATTFLAACLHFGSSYFAWFVCSFRTRFALWSSKKVCVRGGTHSIGLTEAHSENSLRIVLAPL